MFTIFTTSIHMLTLEHVNLNDKQLHLRADGNVLKVTLIGKLLIATLLIILSNRHCLKQH